MNRRRSYNLYYCTMGLVWVCVVGSVAYGTVGALGEATQHDLWLWVPLSLILMLGGGTSAGIIGARVINWWWDRRRPR